MSQQLMKLPADDDAQPLRGRAGAAWRVFRGHRLSDPVYVSLLAAQQELVAIRDVLAAQRLPVEGGLVNAVRALVAQAALHRDSAEGNLAKATDALEFIRAGIQRGENFLDAQMKVAIEPDEPGSPPPGDDGDRAREGGGEAHPA